MSGTTAMAHPILGCAQEIATSLDGVAEIDPMYMPSRERADALLLVQRDLNRLTELHLRLLAAADDMAVRDGARAGCEVVPDRGGAARRTPDPRPDPGHRPGPRPTARRPRPRDAGEGGEAPDRPGRRPRPARAADPGPQAPRGPRPRHRRRARARAPGAGGEAGQEEDLAQLSRPRRRHDHRQGPGSHHARRPAPHLPPLLRQLPAPRQPHRRHRNRSQYTSRTYSDGNPDRPEGAGSPGSHDAADSADGAAGTGRAPTNPDRSPYDVRLGRAFCSLLEHWDPGRMPIHGGAATTVMVTLDVDELRRGLGVATTDTGEKITAGEARRLACTAGIVPVVLGTDSEVLDLGRTARLFSHAQRRAMALRDQTCRAEGCDMPAAWCEAHHVRPWSQGGRTDVTDGVLLCSWHPSD